MGLDASVSSFSIADEWQAGKKKRTERVFVAMSLELSVLSVFSYQEVKIARFTPRGCRRVNM